MGFFLGSEDGNSYFHPGIVWWYRGVANYRQGTNKDQTQTGFENSLLTPYIDGTLFTKDFAYKFQWTFAKRRHGMLDDAFAAYVFAHNSIMGGRPCRQGRFSTSAGDPRAVPGRSVPACGGSLAGQLIIGGGTSPARAGRELAPDGQRHTAAL